MAIRKMLEISTAHLPPTFWQDVDEDEGDEYMWENVPIHWDTPMGVIVWVPDDPSDPANVGSEGDAVPVEIMTLWLYARARDCDYIVLDRDGDLMSDLPLWEQV